MLERFSDPQIPDEPDFVLQAGDFPHKREQSYCLYHGGTDPDQREKGLEIPAQMGPGKQEKGIIVDTEAHASGHHAVQPRIVRRRLTGRQSTQDCLYRPKVPYSG